MHSLKFFSHIECFTRIETMVFLNALILKMRVLLNCIHSHHYYL